MRVAMYYSNNDVRLEEMPVPQIGAGEILMRVKAGGICGTDVVEWYRAGRTPLVLGHEVAGEIVSIGEGVENCKEGDRISVSHHVPCNTCHYCLSDHHTVCETLRKTSFDPGGFAEYIRIPAINVDRGIYSLPDEVSFEEATFIEPLACVFRGQRTARLKPGQSVLIIGSGISGLLHIQLARLFGSDRIVATDINDYRLKAAQKFGADATIHAKEDVPSVFRKINNGLLADLVILCTGAVPAITQALNSVERGGTILFFAPTNQGITIPISINELFWRNEVTLTTSYAANRVEHITALKLIRAKRINVVDMITHKLSLEEAGVGFKLVAEAKESIKVVVEP